MTAGETLLKFTDYPFAYSIVGVALGIIGFSFGQNQIIFLGIAGAFGTLLATTDPIGFMIRKLEANYLKKKLTKDSNLEYFFYQLGALKTKSITYEIEKMIGAFYFIFSIIGFVIAVVVPSPFFDKLMLKDLEGNPLLDELHLKTIYLGLAAIAILILTPKTRQFWKELDGKVDTAAYHMTAINNDNATQTSVESMTRAIEQNDWELAYLWRKKIDEEIQFKKGKREIVIKSAETIFKPLHIESISINSTLTQIPISKNYVQIKADQWKKILNESSHVMIENTQLRKEISDFYDKITEYNQLAMEINNTTQNVIAKEASNIFEKDVSGIRYWIIYNKKDHVAPDMLSCILFNTHPLQTHENARPLQIDLRITDKEKGTEKELRIPAENKEFLKFEKFWENVIKIINSEGQLTKLNKLRSELKIENLELQKKYQSSIELQWKV